MSKKIASNKSKLDPWKIQEGTTTMFLAEVLGTATLIFIGCMSNVGTMGQAPPPPLQTALAFGMTVNLIIMTFGHISGAHLNPAVTLGAVIIGLKSVPTGCIYVLAQFLGAIVGYALIKIVTPAELMRDGIEGSSAPLCVTVVHLDISSAQALLIEILCTSLILIGACATWDPRCAHTTDSTALRFGMAVIAISCAASPYTGCSMNPARTFAPALWNNHWDDQWIYWLGPMLGAAIGTLTYKELFGVNENSDTEELAISESMKMSELAELTSEIPTLEEN